MALFFVAFATTFAALIKASLVLLGAGLAMAVFIVLVLALVCSAAGAAFNAAVRPT